MKKMHALLGAIAAGIMATAAGATDYEFPGSKQAAVTSATSLSTAQILQIYYDCTEKVSQPYCRDLIFSQYQEAGEGLWVPRSQASQRLGQRHR